MARFWPSTCPSSPRRLTMASVKVVVRGLTVERIPSLIIRPGVCASAASGAARRLPVTAERNTLRFMACNHGSFAPGPLSVRGTLALVQHDIPHHDERTRLNIRRRGKYLRDQVVLVRPDVL